MKKLVAIASVLVLVAFAFSSASAQGKLGLNIGGNALLPIGTFSDAASFGFGADAQLEYNITPMAAVFFKTGFYLWPGKTIAGFELPNVKGMPIMVGGRYYFMPEGKLRVYGQAELGLFLGFVSTSEQKFGNIVVVPASSTTTTDFAFAPVFGIVLPAGKGSVDISARYFHIASSGSSLGSIGARVGYMFMLN